MLMQQEYEDEKFLTPQKRLPVKATAISKKQRSDEIFEQLMRANDTARG